MRGHFSFLSCPTAPFSSTSFRLFSLWLSNDIAHDLHHHKFSSIPIESNDPDRRASSSSSSSAWPSILLGCDATVVCVRVQAPTGAASALVSLRASEDNCKRSRLSCFLCLLHNVSRQATTRRTIVRRWMRHAVLSLSLLPVSHATTATRLCSRSYHHRQTCVPASPFCCCLRQ